MQKNYRNAEEWTGDLLGEIITDGKMTFYRNIGFMLTKVLASSSLVLLRKGFGVYYITWATLYWSSLFTFIFLLFSRGAVAGVVMSLHLFAIIIACIYHIFESRRNLRNSTPETARHSMEWGTSLLWIPFVHLAFKANLQNSMLGRMTEYTFQKWIEPLFLIGLGLLFCLFGVYNYGVMLMLSGASIMKLAFIMDRNYYEMKQRAIDAGEYNQVVNTMQEPPRPQNNRVVTRVQNRSEAN